MIAEISYAASDTEKKWGGSRRDYGVRFSQRDETRQDLGNIPRAPLFVS